RQAVALVSDRQARVSAVDLVPGESRPVAEVLASRAAVFANAAGPAQPGNADPRPFREARAARLDDADDLVSEHERQLRIVELTVGDVQIRPAHAAGADAEEDLPRLWIRIRQFAQLERTPPLGQHHRSHRGYSAGICVRQRTFQPPAPRRMTRTSW